MRLSSLQQFILLRCLDVGKKTERGIFRSFYGHQKNPAEEKYQEGIITKSIEGLIDKEMLIGFGKRTPHKWFMTHVKLTKKGIRKAVKILESKQGKLPF